MIHGLGGTKASFLPTVVALAQAGYGRGQKVHRAMNETLIGGAMCFSFFRAQGIPTGDSLVEEEGVELARRALEKAEASTCRLLLPRDRAMMP